MGVRIGVVLVAVVLLSACAAARSGSVIRFDPALYERHTRSGPQLQLHWNLSRGEQGVTAEGYAENVWDNLTRLKWIRLQLVGYDEQGKEVVRSKAVPSRPDMLLTRDNPSFPLEREIYATFRIDLRDPKGAVRFDVVAQYSFDTFPQGEGDDQLKIRGLRLDLRPDHPSVFLRLRRDP